MAYPKRDTTCSVSRARTFMCIRRGCDERSVVRIDATEYDYCAAHGARELSRQIREALKMRYSRELLRLLARRRGVAV